MQLHLFCSVVGFVSDSSGIQIDDGQTVGDLKQAIKHENPNKVRCCAADMALYLATNGRHKWLCSSHATAKRLRKGEIPPSVKAVVADEKAQLDQAWTLAKVLEQHAMPAPASGEYHVFVVLPTLRWRRVAGPTDAFVCDMATLSEQQGRDLLDRLQLQLVHVPTLLLFPRWRSSRL